MLGCLLEKQQTTPDAYPLTLNSLRLACNQSTNRDPVVDYDEATVREAAQRLGKRGWARMASYHGSRSAKYRHLLDDALGLAPDERALLCVLMLRGPQTLGELKQRSERLHAFADLSVGRGSARAAHGARARALARAPARAEGGAVRAPVAGRGRRLRLRGGGHARAAPPARLRCCATRCVRCARKLRR